MNPLLLTYFLYIAISVAFTIWVANTLFKNGRVFLVHMLNENYALADSVNHLLVVGFYLINLGYIMLALKTGAEVLTATAVLEVLSAKIGVVLLVLGMMHFGNLIVFSRIKKETAPALTGASEPDPLLVRDQDWLKMNSSTAIRTNGKSV